MNGYRMLVDENIDPQTADLLRDQGHDAVHIEETLGKGAEDPPIVEYARKNGYLVLTNDTDFLHSDRQQDISVLYCPENAMWAHEIVTLIGELETMIPDQADLPAVPWLTEETFS